MTFARENEKLSARESQPVPNLLCGGAHHPSSEEYSFEMLVFTVVYDRKHHYAPGPALEGLWGEGRSRGGEARCGMERRASEWERGRQSERRDYDRWPVNFGYVTPMGETLSGGENVGENVGMGNGRLRFALSSRASAIQTRASFRTKIPRNLTEIEIKRRHKPKARSREATLSKDARERMLEVRGVVVDVQGQRWSGGRDRMEGLSGCCGGGLEMNGSRGTHQSGGDADGPGARNTVGDAHALGTANGESEPALSARGKKSPIRRAQKTIEAGSLIKADWLNAHSGDPGLGSGMMA
ncbi:hypothetical protein DFP72DRAFT_854371 [Ephemerocybe angulata]|uniref:Uncharacterized protein n=1 Tax=Ephemerocybe angulata TaxID=980116 RepID=A0A8H6HKH7_9AGAR|nr:hypothetical protein DFP72DRAFT_854371 [Tulosesus angulatus]